MRRKLTRIDPLDTEVSKAIGVSIPFSTERVFRSTYESKEALRYNLINFLLTGKNERVLNVEFGAGLQKFLFEDIGDTTLDAIKDYVREQVSIYFPRVVIKELNVFSIPNTNEVQVQLGYEVPLTNIQDEIILNVEQ